MSGHFYFRSARAAFTLVEVTLSLGLVSFALVSILGLLPILLNSMKQSGERAIVTRVYQTVAEDLMNHRTGVGEENEYTFDPEGLLLFLSPPRAGALAPRDGEPRFRVRAASSADFPPGISGPPSLTLTTITIRNIVNGSIVMRRSIWTVPNE